VARRIGLACALVSVAPWIGACANDLYGEKAFEPPAYWDTERYADVDGHRICYMETGHEHPETLVFVHGWSGNLLNWWDQYEELGQRYHVLIFDIPGHGKSSRDPNVDYELDLYVDTTLGLMDERGIDHATLIGNSMGGSIVTLLAARHPERVDSMIIADSTGSGHNGRAGFARFAATPGTIKGVVTGKHYPDSSEKDRARADFVRSFVGTVEAEPYLRMLVDLLRPSMDRIGSEEFSKIDVPTLIIWGDHDHIMPPKGAAVFDESIRNSELYWVEGGRHTPHMENPVEFNCVVLGFLEGTSLEGCRPPADPQPTDGSGPGDGSHEPASDLASSD
jgi:pimeloyl-ACP methyl ester carboxylesterase